MNTGQLEPELRGGVLTCVVSDNKKGHSLSGTRMKLAVAALSDVHLPSSPIRAILVRGQDGTFCNGGDVTAFSSAEDPATYIGDLAHQFHTFVRTLTQAPVPVIAAAQGWAAGAGMSIICAADVIVGGPSTSFRPAYSGIGLSPDGGMTWTLPRLVGFAKARDILLTNSSLRGRSALDAGLITRYVEDDQILSTADQIAHDMSMQSRDALAATKSLLWESQTNSFSVQLDREAASIAQRAGSTDGIEGVAAFIEKRKPSYIQPANPGAV